MRPSSTGWMTLGTLGITMISAGFLTLVTLQKTPTLEDVLVRLPAQTQNAHGNRFGVAYSTSNGDVGWIGTDRSSWSRQVGRTVRTIAIGNGNILVIDGAGNLFEYSDSRTVARVSGRQIDAVTHCTPDSSDVQTIIASESTGIVRHDIEHHSSTTERLLRAHDDSVFGVPTNLEWLDCESHTGRIAVLSAWVADWHAASVLSVRNPSAAQPNEWSDAQLEFSTASFPEGVMFHKSRIAVGYSGNAPTCLGELCQNIDFVEGSPVGTSNDQLCVLRGNELFSATSCSLSIPHPDEPRRFVSSAREWLRRLLH